MNYDNINTPIVLLSIVIKAEQNGMLIVIFILCYSVQELIDKKVIFVLSYPGLKNFQLILRDVSCDPHSRQNV